MTHVFPALDRVSALLWSPDSTLLLAVYAARGALVAHSLADPDWTAKIAFAPPQSPAPTQPPASPSLSAPAALSPGGVLAAWAPDSRHVLLLAAEDAPAPGAAGARLGGQLSVFSLVRGTAGRVGGARFADARALAWSPCGQVRPRKTTVLSTNYFNFAQIPCITSTLLILFYFH